MSLAPQSTAEELREELRREHALHVTNIRTRLDEFLAVPEHRYFYELCYCLMTPQSSALQCDKVCRELEHRNFFAQPFDPTSLLRSFDGGYVRFHNVKARRLLRARDEHPQVLATVLSEASDREVRNTLAREVHGIGMKEASHFLRNIGRTQVTIIDRHILRNMVRLGAIDNDTPPSSPRRYLALEQLFDGIAEELAMPVDELDLLLWRRETGFILK